jgi:bifunctional non-homologous end joining protein LigD
VKLPEFVEPELCKIIASPPSSTDWSHEVKFDGYRMQARVENGRAVLRTRKKLDWSSRFPEITKDCGVLPDGIYDGEIVALDKDGVADFAMLQSALSDKKTANLVFFLFDLPFFEGLDLRNQPLERRKEALRKILEGRARNMTRLRYVSHFSATGGATLDAACRMKLEGVISKRLASPYRGGRNGDWTKAKCRGGQEVVIGGWWGDAHNLRSLLVGAYRDGEFVYLGRVGTGFNRENSGEVLRRLMPLRRKTSPFARSSDVPRTRGIYWVEPRLVAETEFSTITSAGLLRQASFKGLREDKSAKSVVPEEQPAAQQEGTRSMAKPGKSANNKSLRIAGIAISHPEKELWPADKGHKAVTKADLAAYYELAAPRLLPYIEERPVSLVRAPEGIEGQRFFQRHVMEGMQGASSMKVKGEPKPYLMVDDLEGLIGLAQAGGLELHPWGCKKGDPETPAILIFDLDPAPDVDFDTVIDAAKAMRDKLAACGFKPYVKTTGGKGLHVVVAIKGTPKNPVTWKDAKAFARDICIWLERDDPAHYTTNMAKAKRGGKIFLDYLRNDRTSTAVAPWSPRARPHATISLPLSWAQAKHGLDPQDYTIANAKTLLNRADPWKDFAKSAVSLESARKKLNAE